MATHRNLEKFHEAQKEDYEVALKEIKRGKKTGHWMWYIFPQIAGLGLSETSKFYALKNRIEAEEYLNDPTLRKNLLEISGELLELQTANPAEILGNIDSLKLKSSMTLFASLENTDPVFQEVLNKFFDGSRDESTIRLLNAGI